ncbi:hypothetical protein QWM81_19785 [Streptomyces ficellus]|uniref:Integral membrane protein n=1 Tax=Streptomyces ficellus TaxID=1977088 RepID=A0ABT7ZAG6_9ACTN|nr:hypothetical protein [Streptomyces ficellus]MDN3296262.1 hypothetical protein [Streptomyces ficellus]
MGIESDQLVFDYLSRVGDLAQQRQLSSQTRMRLVASLRSEIDSRRAKDDSPAAVRGILTALGTPDEVVAAAASPGAASSGTAGPARPAAPAGPGAQSGRSGPSVPEQRTPRTPRTPRLRRPSVPRPRETSAPDAWSPHLAGMDEVGASASPPDWWRVEEGPFGGEMVPGFRGGLEIPDMLKPPPKRATTDPAAPGPGPEPAAEAVAPAPSAPRRRLPRLGHPLLLAAAALLVTGVVLGSWLPLLAGWLLAYASRRLSRAEAKWVVLGLPGVVAAGAAVWLWGRLDGRWGDPIAPGGDALGAAFAATWPWALRAAALASALHLLWRARRT